MQLQSVNVGHKVLADYASITGRGLMDEIATLAEPLKGLRVLHLSATAFGGGVAEILYTLVPLMQDAGLETEWRIIHGEDEFFDVTKAIHNGLQGHETALTDEQKEIFRRYTKLNADALEGEFDVVIVHDAQPVGIDRRGARPRQALDLPLPHRPVRAEPRRARLPDAVDLALRRLRLPPARLRPGRATSPPAYIWPPAIDPLAPKNMALSPEDASYIVDQFGIDVNRRLITQVSRFDPWKDPLGVIDAWRIVREKHPDVQLALVGSMAHDDPEGWDYYNRTVAAADGDPDVFILSNLNNVGSVEVNAFQVHSRRAHAEVDARGIRPDRHRGALEEPADRGGPRGRDRRPDPGRRDRLPGRLGRGMRRRGDADPRRPRRGARHGAGAARSTCASTS